MAHKTSDGTWRVRKRARIDGRRVRISENFPNKAQAERFEAELRLGRIMAAEVVAAREVAPEAKLAFEVFAEQWLERYCKVEKAPSQLVEDGRVIAGYLNPAFGRVLVGDLRRKHLVDMRQALSLRLAAEKIRPKTANNVLGLAKRILETAVEWEILAANPFKGVKPFPGSEQPFAYWKPDERDHFLRFARQEDARFAEVVLVASHTGLRRSELEGLQRHQLDFERRQIEVSAGYCFKSRARHERTKNRLVAWVPMNDVVFEALKDRQLMAPTARVFPHTSLLHASRRLRELCLRVGARPIRFHDLRHTFASCLVMAGVTLYTVQRLMRHESIKQTERYAHLAPGYLADAANALVRTPGPDLAPARAGLS